jgi:hypothetical protein
LVAAGFSAFYVFVHHAFIANAIVFILDNIIYFETVDCIGTSFSLPLCDSQPTWKPPPLVPLTLAQA